MIESAYEAVLGLLALWPLLLVLVAIDGAWRMWKLRGVWKKRR